MNTNENVSKLNSPREDEKSCDQTMEESEDCNEEEEDWKEQEEEEHDEMKLDARLIVYSTN